MTFLEKDLEDIIYKTPNYLLHDRGLYIYGKKIRQLKIGNYGIADVISVVGDTENNLLILEIFELKKDVINTSAFLQCLRYAKGVDMWLRANKNFNYRIELTLIGRSIDLSDNIIYLTDFYTDFKFYTYDYDFSGITFTQNSKYHLTNQGF